MATKKKTQKDRLINALDNDFYGLTSTQLAKRIKGTESSVRRLISELRLDGVPVIRSTTDNTYIIGTPSKNLISFAAEFGGPELFRAE